MDMLVSGRKFVGWLLDWHFSWCSYSSSHNHGSVENGLRKEDVFI